MLRTAAIDQLTDTTPKIAGLMDRLEAAEGGGPCSPKRT